MCSHHEFARIALTLQSDDLTIAYHDSQKSFLDYLTDLWNKPLTIRTRVLAWFSEWWKDVRGTSYFEQRAEAWCPRSCLELWSRSRNSNFRIACCECPLICHSAAILSDLYFSFDLDLSNFFMDYLTLFSIVLCSRLLGFAASSERKQRDIWKDS